ncbi:MarR family winged helix-turn-helix transcriptional regulator [Streptomyces fuscigenes]|uniref:MarR family winged helix-turn-helix transcriptional regulator n=1 Tax=Streptomyces fuscigenes TaxID=1528880 RepID=UPI001F2CB9CA|nr:MarR family transcriptional regulator [Streptomyces fuscigenes]MCF3962419.1 MarR family transcriptional regulator [Streptomyces fuscigenes]
MKIDRSQPAPSRTPRPHASKAAESGCTAHEGMRRLIQLLPRVTRGLRRRPAGPIVLENVPLGPTHGSALALIQENGGVSVGALATALDLTMATVSGLVADLESVGFAERSPDPGDRRRTLVRLVAGSESLVDAWLEGATAPIVRALQQLSPSERTTFVKAMGLLDRELNAPS